MFKRIRRRVRLIAGAEDYAATPRDAAVQLRVPNPYGGQPWLTATIALSNTPSGHGETLRVRAHFDGALSLPHPGSARRERLARDTDSRGGLTRYGRNAAAALARGVIDRLPARQLESLATRRWRSWVDLQMSTSPLDGGAEALMPEPLRGLYGGALPRAGTGQPRIGIWTGPAGGPLGGIAQLALLQLDERDLGRDRSTKDSPRFNFNASVAQVVEPVMRYDSDQ